MDMFTLTTKILAIQRIAERHGGAVFDARSAKEVIYRTGALLDVIAEGGSREQLYDVVCWMRTDESWPGGLAGWRWFDDRLFVLAQYLEQDETFPSQAELVEELERACRAGVIR